MKKLTNCVILLFLVLILSGCSNDNQNDTSYDTSRTSSNSQENNSISNSIDSTTKPQPKQETEIAVYSTKLSGRDTPRSRNIIITSNTLNGTIIEPNQTFSFCDIVGVCTEEKGYEKADSFDADGKKVKTLGGGNCQVSSTIYNAVLLIPELSIVERHAHSGHVDYVPEDKDAAVSHGSVDFKFKNTLTVPVKLYINSDLNGVNVRLVRID